MNKPKKILIDIDVNTKSIDAAMKKLTALEKKWDAMKKKGIIK